MKRKSIFSDMNSGSGFTKKCSSNQVNFLDSRVDSPLTTTGGILTDDSVDGPEITRISHIKSKSWEREDAVTAIELEKEYNELKKKPLLVLKFPDPELSKTIVQNYSPFIENVIIGNNILPRYCFVQIKPDADIDKVKSDLNNISFGEGKIKAELRVQNMEDELPEVTPEEIDPYTLYVGNFPAHVPVRVIREYFPKSLRINIGYDTDTEYTRYLFVRYANFEDSVNAFKKIFNTLIGNRILSVRFRRAKANVRSPLSEANKNAVNNNDSDLVICSENPVSQKSPAYRVFKPHKFTPYSNRNKNQKDSGNLNEEVDSKIGVFDEATKIIESLTQNHDDDEPYVKKEIQESDDTDDDLLGTKFFDSSSEDNDKLTETECLLDLGEIPENSNVPCTSPGSRTFCGKDSNFFLKEIRQVDSSNLLADKDQKPDLETLSGYQKALTLSKNLLYRNDGQHNKNQKSLTNPTSRNKITMFSIEKKNDDLDDLFRSMNPDDDEDEYQNNIF